MDDILIYSTHRLDAYQVKWSKAEQYWNYKTDFINEKSILINFKIQELNKELDKFELIKDLSDFKKIKELFKDILLKLN